MTGVGRGGAGRGGRKEGAGLREWSSEGEALGERKNISQVERRPVLERKHLENCQY
jgi:hypothetical protein